MTPLHLAGLRGDLDQLRGLIASGASLDVRDERGFTPATWALRNEHWTGLRVLLQAGATLTNPLTAAIVLGDGERVSSLCQNADLQARDRFDRTALMYATCTRQPELIECLVQAGADPELPTLDGGNILDTATRDADPTVFTVLLRAGVDVNHRNGRGQTPLIRLLGDRRSESNPGRSECAALLVAAGALLHYPDPRSRLIHHCALQQVLSSLEPFNSSRDRLLRFLLDRGGIELVRARGAAALCQAVRSGHIGALDALFLAGVSPDAREHGSESAVELAVRFRRPDIVSRLIEHGARAPGLGPGELDEYSVSAEGLEAAIRAENLEAVQTKLGHAAIIRACAAHGADVQSHSSHPWGTQTPLLAAVLNGHIECVQTLIACGSDAKRWPANGELHEAAERGQNEVVRLLLGAGFDPCAFEPRRGSPLALAAKEHHFQTADILLASMHNPEDRRAQLGHALRYCIYKRSPTAVRYVLDQAPELYDEPETEFGERPIEAAAIRADAAILRLLLSYGPCSIEGSGGRFGGGETPLMSAVLQGGLEAVRILVEAGARVQISEERLGHTPLMYACHVGRGEAPEIVSYLLSRGAEIDARAKDGQTALMMAVSAELYGVVQQLLSANPDLSLRDDQGRNVTDLACERNCPEVLELLAAATARSRA